ncbi:hypothetical protein CASFOL_037639 [Castilleja foliolosa]|uniref:CCHC-type domain-containing protein n=1 Tax=Castilleja foliolosa TaxID=1961234 RepID=A0ABD3BPC5_9LAMI
MAFKDHQTVLAWWPPDKALAEVDLDTARFWVHIYGIPVSYINPSNVEMLANEIGTFVKTDLHSPAQKWKRYVKIEIDININKPLLSYPVFSCDWGKRLMLEIRYERLIDFCHTCGRIGHKGPYCSWKGQDDGEIEERNFGPWMKFEAPHITNPKLASQSPERKCYPFNKDNRPNSQSSPNLNLAENLNWDKEKMDESVPTPDAKVTANLTITDNPTLEKQKLRVENPKFLPQKECSPTAQKANPDNLAANMVSEAKEKLAGQNEKGLGLADELGKENGPSGIYAGIGPNSNKLGPSLKRKLAEMVYEPADVVFISEVKSPLSPLISNSLKALNFTKSAFSPPIGKSGGLILAWKDNINLTILSIHSNLFHTSILDATNSRLFTPVYVPCNHIKKDLFWKDIGSLNLNPTLPWLMTGDFNDITDQKEKKGGLSFTSSSTYRLVQDLHDNV